MNVDIFGYFAAILTTAAFLPQLIKTLKTKKADDVSLTTLIMFIIGVLSWIIYGYKISSTPIASSAASDVYKRQIQDKTPIINIIKVVKETSSAFFVFNVLSN